MIGFYALALAIAGGLIAVPVAELAYLHRIDFRLAIFCLVVGFAILRAILPRRDVFDPPGPALTRAEQPRLFQALEQVAGATAQAMPSDVYLTPEVNAWVAQRGGVMGVGSRRVMGLGLPLLQALSVDEVRAVLAHEFGHYHGGDTALGPWVYKTRAAIARTLQALAQHSTVLMKPFEWYGLGFLRITHAISRRQEYAADALAARTIGAAPLASGLRALQGIAGVFVPYWFSGVAPVLERGYRPPIAAGFTQFLASSAIAPQVEQAIEHEMTSGAADPYDTHPPLRERMAALGDAAERATPDAGPRAIALLDRVDELEARLVAHVSERKGADPPAAIPWSEVGPRVWTAIWRDQVRVAGNRLSGLTPKQIPLLAADLAGTAVRFGFAPHRQAAVENQLVNNVVGLLGAALSVALLDRGWTVSAPPGEVVVVSRPDATTRVTPFADIVHIAQGKLTADQWEATWRNVGLLDLDLGTLVARGIDSTLPQGQPSPPVAS
jgi:Zn-dependent protease with chaperone function